MINDLSPQHYFKHTVCFQAFNSQLYGEKKKVKYDLQFNCQKFYLLFINYKHDSITIQALYNENSKIVMYDIILCFKQNQSQCCDQLIYFNKKPRRFEHFFYKVRNQLISFILSQSFFNLIGYFKLYLQWESLSYEKKTGQPGQLFVHSRAVCHNTPTGIVTQSRAPVFRTP